MSVHYLVVKGPFGDMKVNPKIFKFEFNENETETQFVTLPLPDSAECNRLLAAKTINLRYVLNEHNMKELTKKKLSRVFEKIQLNTFN